MSAPGAVGMIGLGRTGMPIARNLLARGRAVVGFRRSADLALEQAGGRTAPSPRELAAEAEVILSVLPSVTALDEVMSGPRGLLEALGPKHTVVELSSYPLEVKQKYERLVRAKGAGFVDGEISGTPAMTAARTSVFLLSGDQAACDRALQICREASEHAIYCGAFGSATKLKLVANLLVAVHTAAAAEAMLLVERAGLDPTLAIEVLGLGAGSSTMFKARAGSMHARKFVDPAPGPVSMLSAYFDSISALAASAGAPTPLFSNASALFRAALAEGRGPQDIGCVIELLASTHAS